MTQRGAITLFPFSGSHTTTSEAEKPAASGAVDAFSVRVVAELDVFRAELLRQKIVFEGELRRQREVYEERIGRLEESATLMDAENRHLRSSIQALSIRLDAAERGRAVVARSPSRPPTDVAPSSGSIAPSTPRGSQPVTSMTRSLTPQPRAASSGGGDGRGRSPSSRELVALAKRPSLLTLPPPTLRAALLLAKSNK